MIMEPRRPDQGDAPSIESVLVGGLFAVIERFVNSQHPVTVWNNTDVGLLCDDCVGVACELRLPRRGGEADEEGAPNTHMRRALFDGDGEVVGHAHREHR